MTPTQHSQQPIDLPEREQQARTLGQQFGPFEAENFDYFTDTATYANVVLPRLRELAGFDDSGVGTHTVDRTIVATDDRHSEPFEVNASDVLDGMVDAFIAGAHDDTGTAAEDLQ